MFYFYFFMLVIHCEERRSHSYLDFLYESMRMCPLDSRQVYRHHVEQHLINGTHHIFFVAFEY